MDRAHLDIDADAGIPDLVRSLGEDSKQLLTDEVRLAKLELKESVRRAGAGAVRIGIAFGVGVVALVAFTMFLVTLIGRVASGHMWVGAIVTGVLELAAAALLAKKGFSTIGEPSYSLVRTRTSIRDTATWVRHPRR